MNTYALIYSNKTKNILYCVFYRYNSPITFTGDFSISYHTNSEYIIILWSIAFLWNVQVKSVQDIRENSYTLDKATKWRWNVEIIQILKNIPNK